MLKFRGQPGFKCCGVCRFVYTPGTWSKQGGREKVAPGGRLIVQVFGVQGKDMRVFTRTLRRMPKAGRDFSLCNECDLLRIEDKTELYRSNTIQASEKNSSVPCGCDVPERLS